MFNHKKLFAASVYRIFTQFKTVKNFTTIKLLLVLGVFFASQTLVFAQNWNWQPYTPKNESWSILAPGPMQPDAEALKPNGEKGSYSFNDYYGFFAIIFRDSPKRFLPWKPDYKGYIEEIRDDVVKSNNGEIIKDVEFSNGRFKGREVKVKFVSGTTRGVEGQVVAKYRVQRFRMFFVGKRFYAVLAVLPESEIDKPEIDKYFDSFSFNTAPTAKADSYSVNEDITRNVSAGNGVLANDSDAEDNTLTVSGAKPVTLPSHGTLTLNSDGSFIYKPNPNFFGQDFFTYKANDGLLDSAIATVTITVNPVNDAPTISNVPPSLSVDELAPAGFTAAANDIDSPVGSLRFSLTNAPSGASINPANGAFSWTPSEAQGPGIYNFQVIVSDGQLTASAPVNITVKEVNSAPQFSNSVFSAAINELEPYSFAASASDSDIPAQTLTYSLINAPSGANINSANGTMSWTPTEAQGDGSTYKFTVRVTDGLATTDAAVNLTVREVNSPPILAAIPDQSIDELKTSSVAAKGGDADIPANNLTYSLGAGAPSGMAINPHTGVISWIPDESQGAGDYSVTVRLTDDGKPALSDARTFKIHVDEVNSAPKFNAIGNKSVDEENLLTFNIKATDTDLPANTLTYSMMNAPTGASLDSSTGVFSWTPTEMQGAGTYDITFRVSDNGTPSMSDQQTIRITVNEVNKPPVAENGVASLDEDSRVSIELKAFDPDLPANNLAFSIVSPPAHGKLSGTSPNLTYQPNPDYNGTDNFTFRVSDAALNSNTATVNITIKPVNDSPFAAADNAVTTVDSPVDINVIANDTDIDGDKIVLVNVSNAVNGKAEIVGGQVRFTPNPKFQGTGSFTYMITDGQGGTSNGKVTINVKPNN